MRKVDRLIERILVLVPDAKVSVRDDDYDSIKWHPDNESPQPNITACRNVTVAQMKAKKEGELKADLQRRAQGMDAVDKLILRGMFKDLKQRGVVNNLEEFWSFLKN